MTAPLPESGWLRVESPSAVYAVAFEGDVIVECAPYARPILRSMGRNVHTFVRYVEGRGATVEALTEERE